MTALSLVRPAHLVERATLRRALTGAVCGAAGVLALALAWLTVGGGGAFTVVSASMAPALDTGDVVLIERIDARDARPGEIIAFPDAASGRTTVHRARRVETARTNVSFITRGDANGTSERWQVPVDGKVGRVVGVVPRAGLLTGFASSPFGWIVLVVLPGVVLVVLEVRHLRRGAAA